MRKAMSSAAGLRLEYSPSLKTQLSSRTREVVWRVVGSSRPDCRIRVRRLIADCARSPLRCSTDLEHLYMSSVLTLEQGRPQIGNAGLSLEADHTGSAPLNRSCPRKCDRE